LPLSHGDPASTIAGTEFVRTSISSKGHGTDRPAGLEALLWDDPFVKNHGDHRGYVGCRIDGKTWRSDFRTIDRVTVPDSPLKTPASFVVESGRSGLQRV
jgi:alkaline phosphatase D